MASQKHTTDPVQLDLAFGPQEEWRAVPGYEGLYEVSNLGRVRSLDTLQTQRKRTRRKHGKLLHLVVRKKKYRFVSLCKEGQVKPFFVHTLVLMAFVGPKPHGHEVNHIDGNGSNNKPENLEWVTPLQNMRHAYNLGLIPAIPAIGEENPQAKLKDADILAIRRMRKEGMMNKDIAKFFNVSPGMTSMIATGKRWTHLKE